MIGVQDNGNAVGGCNRTNVLGCGNSTGDGGLLLVILDTLVDGLVAPVCIKSLGGGPTLPAKYAAPP